MEERQKRIANIQIWVFSIGFAIILAFFFYGLYERIDNNQALVFFRQGEDYMADFFNVLQYSEDLNPYVNEINGFEEKAYFPLSYVIFFVFGKLMRFDGYDGTLESVNFQELVFTNCIMMLMMALLAAQIFDMLDKEKWYKFLIAAILMVSGVSLFSYERGNIIVLAVSGMLFFIATYDSENKILRELGYIALAFAAALKGYPAILGLLLVYKMQWKEVFRLVVYGVIAAFGPFLLMEGGVSNIQFWQRNWKLNTEVYEFVQQPKLGYYYFIAYAKDLAFEQREHLRDVWKPIINILAVLGVASNFFQKRKWMTVGMLTVIILMIPSNCGYYCLLYIFPVILLYLNEKDKRWLDLAYIPIFLMLLCPFQMIEKETGKNLTLYWSNVALVVLFASLLLENIWCMIQVSMEKKKKGITTDGN